jgi:hypothetical protein
LVEDFTISATSEQLNEVVVKQLKTIHLQEKKRRTVFENAIENIEIPAVYTTISNELLKNK